MIYYKSQEEIEKLRKSALLVSRTLAEVAKYIKPGESSLTLDRIAEEYIRDNGGRPAFKNYKGFPYSLCISMNETVVHGFPSTRELTENDIISVDCGVEIDGYYGDTAYTFALAGINSDTEKLLRATKTSLYLAIEQAVAGNRVGDIGFAIQNYVERGLGHGVVRELVGHGVGRNLHEDPEVPNYGKRGSGLKLQEGLVIAIEPMVNLGVRGVVQLKDGWTINTADRKPSAHYELMLAVRKGKADVLSTFEYLEAEEVKNDNLKKIEVNQELLVS
jgi:methionyl aminopeptidase